jgi:hypothetical protein
MQRSSVSNSTESVKKCVKYELKFIYALEVWLFLGQFTQNSDLLDNFLKNCII